MPVTIVPFREPEVSIVLVKLFRSFRLRDTGPAQRARKLASQQQARDAKRGAKRDRLRITCTRKIKVTSNGLLRVRLRAAQLRTVFFSSVCSEREGAMSCAEKAPPTEQHPEYAELGQ